MKHECLFLCLCLEHCGACVLFVLLCELSQDCNRPVWTHLTEHKGGTVDKRDKDKERDRNGGKERGKEKGFNLMIWTHVYRVVKTR